MLKTILIVEDETPLSAALRTNLVKAGYITTVVADGQLALEAIKLNEYSLVLLDLVIPKLDGFKTLEQIRQLKQDQKVMILSNLSQPEDVARLKKLGISSFYIKSDTPLSTIVAMADELTF